MRAIAAQIGAATAKSMSATHAGRMSGPYWFHLVLRRARSAASVSSKSMAWVEVMLRSCAVLRPQVYQFVCAEASDRQRRRESRVAGSPPSVQGRLRLLAAHPPVDGDGEQGANRAGQQIRAGRRQAQA